MHLRDRLKKQSNERESLVRQHFGLFVHCAEGLAWLQAYRQGETDAHTHTPTPRPAAAAAAAAARLTCA